jgi:hypothetical protein
MRTILILTFCCAIAPLAGASPQKTPTPVPHYGKPTIYKKPGPLIPKKPVVSSQLIPKKPVLSSPLVPKKPVVTSPLIPKTPVLSPSLVPKKPVVTLPLVPKTPVATTPDVPKTPTPFIPNYSIPGSKNWKGPEYVVFINYHPHWHNQLWWKSHYNHIVFVFGGWYYWSNGYWYPTWGYARNAHYAYDGPIYAASPDVDPGQVVTSVQSALQQQGYYQGDIDGMLGPDTSAALAAYQQAQGLETTGAIDEPTLASLGLT